MDGQSVYNAKQVNGALADKDIWHFHNEMAGTYPLSGVKEVMFLVLYDGVYTTTILNNIFLGGIAGFIDPNKQVFINEHGAYAANNAHVWVYYKV